MSSTNPLSGTKQNEKRKYEGSQTGDEAKSHSKHSSYPEVPEKRQRTIGPALPPSHIQRSDSDHNTGNDSDSGSDDDIGPSLPPPNAFGSDGGTDNTTVTDIHNIHSGDRNLGPRLEDASVDTNEVQRDEWMLLPPGQSNSASRVDPTKLRNRKFNTGRSARAPDTINHGPAASWIETPEQKIRRLENEVMGVAPASTGLQEATIGMSKADEAIEERIQLYNEKKRKTTLYEDFQRGSNGSGKEDDPSSRPFDREKDMAAAASISNAERREIINRSANFKSRFTKGRFL
ncbi:hypothetical protein VTN00DRAFT_2870 [Thermoascus crustaceus]|uniref:uncharacterized protein n=1 Tax=Thermoascus crustaceus TaxID=5088 RepID=UPI003743AF56